MVTFGRYKNVLTYKQLCEDKFKTRYVDWCLNESSVDDRVKERLQYFADKCRDFDGKV
jgi:hypothetical protein